MPERKFSTRKILFLKLRFCIFIETFQTKTFGFLNNESSI
ncbi:hypothetical protein LEP1GSC132_2264 [Leptospira kirschneri str. 200803703]|uniref:Uncharacterized protein n=1 Tax=Leptospira kirschneri str. 200802841 TaxID=1193047 RepID=A0A828Y4M1_9LEPT|nr:hypothetical protein LEP1GSC131_1320 [Leptospira kirschneri str. 200802841]EKP05352.1 hypothetical protein LEP1GSC018_1468 [Leptospira kirschneri str. 2008720114]EKQ83246.1 hypothetical protein LEP1GSC064_1232 [Leptospira kirschneri serovar Grippotyphosa str. Moskva]EMK00705.1 hypothetical protein LEP1GSC176_0750 [Leptospira kirschneri str. MMD1493]EMO68076.1 hypothetical protein LEP1GSC132_2264 [Leptospira kirschneri str. 200803703]EMO82390.1 hypothetical protein LEP1GSC126_1445 [Leptospir